MRFVPLLMIVIAAGGCTASQLRRDTLHQTRTVTDLHHQIVLNNLAAFACNPYAIPSQVNLRNGTAQVADSSSGTIEYVTGGIGGILGFGRANVLQWNTAPVTDETTLRLLRIAYRRSLGFADDLYTDDFANRVAHRLKVQMATTPDMALENAHMFARGPALPQLLDRAGWKGDLSPGFSGDDPAVQLWQKDTGDIIATSSERIVQEGEILSGENLVIAPVLIHGIQTVGPGESAPRVYVATPFAAEVRRQVLALNNYLLDVHPGWLGMGRKHDVPKDACYVGHYRHCGCDCYVWVLPHGRDEFEDFTLRVLRLSTMIMDANTGAVSSGIMYSPPVAR